MHIAILSQPSNFHCQKWARALKKVGLQVTVFSLEDYQIPDVQCINLNTRAGWGYKDFFLTRRRLREALRSEGVDVLHPLHLTPYGVWGYWSGFEPMISAAIGADVFEYLPSQAIPNLNYRHWKNLHSRSHWLYQLQYQLSKRFHKRMVQKVLEHSRYVTADNQELIKALQQYFRVPKEKLVLQRWGVEEELFEAVPVSEHARILKEWGLNPEKPIILSPRGLMPVYQADIILSSFASLVGRYPNFQWVVLSAGYPVSPECQKMIVHLKKEFPNFYAITDQIPRDKMTVLWKHTVLFISAPIYDGYSATIAEGRYVGAIPVVNKIPGNEEVIQHLTNGFIVHPFDYENLTQSLIEILENFDFYYSQFKPVNQSWMRAYGSLTKDAAQFYEWLNKVYEGSS